MIIHANIPEEVKIEIRLMKAVEGLVDCIAEGFEAYIKPRGGEDRQRLLPLRQEVLEYIALMQAGLKTFLDAHPIPEKE